MEKKKSTERFTGKGFWDAINQAKKDPRFFKEINAFIKASKSVYKLK